MNSGHAIARYRNPKTFITVVIIGLSSFVVSGQQQQITVGEPWYTPYRRDACAAIENAIPPIVYQDDCVTEIPEEISPGVQSNCRPMCIVCYEWCRLQVPDDPDSTSPAFIIPKDMPDKAECDCYGGITTTPTVRQTASSSAQGIYGQIHASMTTAKTITMLLTVYLLAGLMLLPLVSAQTGDGNTGENLLDPIHPYSPSAVMATRFWPELNQCTKAYSPSGCSSS